LVEGLERPQSIQQYAVNGGRIRDNEYRYERIDLAASRLSMSSLRFERAETAQVASPKRSCTFAMIAIGQNASQVLPREFRLETNRAASYMNSPSPR
jgi:hypothetical protein